MTAGSAITMAVIAASVLATRPARIAAQEDGPVAACADAAGDAGFCRTVAQGAEAMLPALVIAASGGNPVPGTASTLGMRLTAAPRWTLGGRNTLAWPTAPDLVQRGGGNDLGILPFAFAIDGSVGLLQGWNPLPTVGGVGSLDLLFGASLVPLLASDEYGGTGGWSWAAGARAGLLRESFTLPGVSVSAMYRQLRGVSLGDDQLQSTDSYLRTDLGVISLRAAASKAILLLNVTAGIGYDVMYGDVELGYEGTVAAVRLIAPDARMERVTVFGSVSYTLMVLNFVLGGGWQEAPPAIDGADAGEYSPSGALYASAALRLSI